MTELDDFGHHDEAPISPKSFIDRIQPTWARIYIELAHETNNKELDWHSDRVLQAFIALTGFRPARAAYLPLSQQLAALQVAYEVVKALFEADELAQLDGQPALDFAFGWMACHDLVTNVPIESETVDLALDRAIHASNPRYPDAFRSGFKARFEHKS